MSNLKIKTALLMLSSIAVLNACVSTPEPLLGEYPTIEPQQAASLQANQSVRWGGVIIAVKPETSSTCLEILSKPLTSTQRPVNEDGTTGRFIACKNQFIDPAVFAEGREVTVTGRLNRLENREIGEYLYQYPIIDADTIYLWEERQEEVYYYTGGMYYWPYYQPYYPRHYYPIRTVPHSSGKKN